MKIFLTFSLLISILIGCQSASTVAIKSDSPQISSGVNHQRVPVEIGIQEQVYVYSSMYIDWKSIQKTDSSKILDGIRNYYNHTESWNGSISPFSKGIIIEQDEIDGSPVLIVNFGSMYSFTFLYSNSNEKFNLLVDEENNSTVVDSTGNELIVNVANLECTPFLETYQTLHNSNQELRDDASGANLNSQSNQSNSLPKSLNKFNEKFSNNSKISSILDSLLVLSESDMLLGGNYEVIIDKYKYINVRREVKNGKYLYNFKASADQLNLDDPFPIHCPKDFLQISIEEKVLDIITKEINYRKFLINNFNGQFQIRRLK